MDLHLYDIERHDITCHDNIIKAILIEKPFKQVTKWGFSTSANSSQNLNTWYHIHFK
jgi:hypothetical protein